MSLPSQAPCFTETEGTRLYQLALEATREAHSFTDMAELLPRLVKSKAAWKLAAEQLLQEEPQQIPRSITCLAHCYTWGHHVDKNQQKAKELYELACSQDYPTACYFLTSNYSRDDEHAEALKWYHHAAELGSSSAMCQLGFIYREGDSAAKKDVIKAEHWFQKAAEVKPSNHYQLARFYQYVKSDHLKALESYELLRAATGRKSYSDLAILYASKKSPYYSPEKAMHCYQKTMEENKHSEPRCLIALAGFFRAGEGVTQDIPKAREYLQRVVDSTKPTNSCHKEALALLKSSEGELW